MPVHASFSKKKKMFKRLRDYSKLSKVLSIFFRGLNDHTIFFLRREKAFRELRMPARWIFERFFKN